MLQELEAGPEVFKPSAFWEELGRRHVDQLSRYGFDNFKRTVNQQYFYHRLIAMFAHHLAIVRYWLAHPAIDVLRARFPNPRSDVPGLASFNASQAWLWKTFVAMHASVLARNDPLRLLDVIEEPLVGNPLAVEYRGRRISQDLCNSVHEFYTIVRSDDLRGPKPLTAAELGAGYGRLAYLFLVTVPHAFYTIIDIPPALYVSQRYLTTVLPAVPTFRFRPFRSFDEVRHEFERSRLRFLLPHQAEMLPDDSLDYFINISTLHEMTRAQVGRYFGLMDRMCRGRVYTKQWRKSRTRVDGIAMTERDYPVPTTWRTVFQRRHPIQRWFFHALYEVQS